MQIRGKHQWQLIWIKWAWHFEMFRITESLFLATLPSLFNLRETTMTWSLAFLGTSFWFWEKMRNVFVIIITVTINNSKLKVAGHCKRLVFSYSFPKGWHLSQKYFLIKLILLLTLTGTLINHKVEEWRKKLFERLSLLCRPHRQERWPSRWEICHLVWRPFQAGLYISDCLKSCFCCFKT